MDNDPAEAATARIEAALSRLEGALRPGNGDPATAHRHQALRQAVAEAIGQLDSLIVRAEA